MIEEARNIAAHTLNLLCKTGTPDSCILASEVVREAARELGYAVTMQPVYVKVLALDGSTAYDLEQRLEFVPPQNYPGHLVVLLNDTILTDATSIQFLARLKWPYTDEPVVAIEVPAGFAEGNVEARYDGPQGALVYRAFDDKGDWTEGRDTETEMAARFVGKTIAAQCLAERATDGS